MFKSKLVFLKTTLILLLVGFGGYLAWRYIIPHFNYNLQHPADTEIFTTGNEKVDIEDKYNDLYIISYANEAFFRGLENFVGSIHFWEPELKIIIYDLGMSANHVEDIRTWKNTQLFHFDFLRYPPHVQDLYKYAWKVIILNETFHTYNNIFLEDSGHELRNKIDPIRRIIQREGFFTIQSTSIERDKRLSHPLTEKYLGISLKTGQISGGILGLMKDHSRNDVISVFVQRALECALKEECIAPEGSSLGNHRYDQTVFSLLAQEYGLKGLDIEVCWVDTDGVSYPALTEDPRTTNDILICSRRGRGNQPYAQFLVRE